MPRRVLLLVSLALLIAGCSRPAEPPLTAEPVGRDGPAQPQTAPIRMGAVFPLSAGAGRIGELKRQGAEIAIEHLNADGGVKGRTLEVLYEDSKNSTREAEAAFLKLVEVNQVPVVMSAISQISLALAPLADRRQVVLFANASHPELPAKSPYVFRNLPDAERTGTVMADTAYRDLGLSRVAILYLNDDYGQAARKVFQTRFESLGGTITGVDSFERTATDVRSLLYKLAQDGPEAYWIPGYGSALGLVLKQKREANIQGVVLADLGLADDEVLDLAGPAADGAYVVTPLFDASSDRPLVERFVRDYVERFGENPSFDAAFQYDAVLLIAKAMETASELTGPAIRDALADIQGFEGVCGPMAFDADGDGEMQVVVRMVADGRIMEVELEPIISLTDPVPPMSPEEAGTAPTDETGSE